MKNYSLSTLIGLCFIYSFSMTMTGCGKKGDLVRPVQPEEQQLWQEELIDKQKQSLPEKTPKLENSK